MAAMRAIGSGFSSVLASRKASTSVWGQGRNSSRRQRDRKVGSSRPGAWQTRNRTPRGGGSSRVFKTALAALGFRSSAASMIAALQGEDEGDLEKNSGRRRASSTGMTFRALPSSPARSSTSRSGCERAATCRLTGCSGSEPSRPWLGSGPAPRRRRTAR